MCECGIGGCAYTTTGVYVYTYEKYIHCEYDYVHIVHPPQGVVL